MEDFGSFAAVLIPVVGSIALFSFLAVAAWSDARRREREAYYTSETLKKIAETPGDGANAAIAMIHEQERNTRQQNREKRVLGGLITSAVGIGMMVFLHGVEHDEPAYLVGLIPLLIGLALLFYSYALAPKE